MRTWYIYALVDPRVTTGHACDEVRYIGKSSNPDWRLERHWRDRHVGGSYKDRWLSNLDGPPILRILDSGTGSWDEAERFWIDFYKNEVEARLTNLTPGGQGCPDDFKQSDHTRKLKSLACSGWHHTAESKAKIARKRNPYSSYEPELAKDLIRIRNQKMWTTRKLRKLLGTSVAIRA